MGAVHSVRGDGGAFSRTLTPPRRRVPSWDCVSEQQDGASQASDGTGSSNWGWFEDTSSNHASNFGAATTLTLQSLATPATEPPLYVLESPLPCQRLWHETAGRRPQQPENERKHFENQWAQNFQNSQAAPAAQAAQSVAAADMETTDDLPEVDFQGEVLFRGRAPFSCAVSRSFLLTDAQLRRSASSGLFASASRSTSRLPSSWNSVTLQLPRFRAVHQYSEAASAVTANEPASNFPSSSLGLLLLPTSLTDSCGALTSPSAHGEFLVVVSLRGVQNSSITFGVWRRHSHFAALAKAIASEPSVFKNSLLSWQCLLSKKHTFRCLDKEYLSLKCYLMERFLHDVLFESPSPQLVSAFLDLEV